MKRRRYRLQNSCRRKRRMVPGNVLELFTLETELYERPIASAPGTIDGELADTKIAMADTLQKTHDDAKKAREKLRKSTKSLEGSKEAYTEKIDSLLEKLFETFVAYRTSALDNQTTFGRECDTEISGITSMTAEGNR